MSLPPSSSSGVPHSGGVLPRAFEQEDSGGEDSEVDHKQSYTGTDTKPLHHNAPTPLSSEEDDITVDVVAHKFYLSAVSFPVDMRAMESCTICRVCLADPPLGLRDVLTGVMQDGGSGLLATQPYVNATPSTVTAAAAALALAAHRGKGCLGLVGLAGGERRAGSVSPRTAITPSALVAEGLHTTVHTTTTTALYAGAPQDGSEEFEVAGNGRRRSAATKDGENEEKASSRHGSHSVAGPVPLDAVLVSTGLCGHAFHTFCLDEWKRTNSNCPLCDSPWEEPNPPRTLE